MIKHRIATAALAASLVGTAAAGTVADVAAQSNRGGAAGLVAVLAQVAADDVVDVRVVDSFNNLRALNNVLSNNDVDVTVGDVTILQDFLNDNNIDIDVEDFLNNLEVDIDDVVAIGILNGQDVIVFV